MRRRAAVLLAAGALAAACSNGQSILEAGNEAIPTTEPPPSTAPVTAAPGETLPPTTTSSTIAVTTTTTPLSTLPPCPVDALGEGGGDPIELTFWHAMTGMPEDVLIELTEAYNAGQDRVRVVLQNQGGSRENIDKYLQSGQDSRPNIVQLPEYIVQQIADTGSVVPVGACIVADGYDTSAFLSRVIGAYNIAGVQWSMPFNVSNPVLYFNKKIFSDAGLNPNDPPLSLEELRSASQAIVESGAASTGIALDSGPDSGGGWFLEQWFARAGQFYADNGNGRLAPATKVLYNGRAGVGLLTFLQQMIDDGLAVTVGDNPGSQDTLLRMANPAEQAAMAIASSAGIGTVIDVVGQGLIPGLTSDDIGVGAMPGPGNEPGVLVGGASLFIVAEKGDPATAAAWDYVKALVTPEAQSTWAARTGYVPVRDDALEVGPLASTYEEDPRFAVPYEQLVAPADDLAALGPVLGPLREVRSVTARAVASIFNGEDVQQALDAAARQANALITDYNTRN